VTFWICLYACSRKEDFPSGTVHSEWLSGGLLTIFQSDAEAYRVRATHLAASEIQDHLEGDLIFHAVFSADSETPFQGLGPLFIQHSCEGCHNRNGRSHPPLNEADNSSGLLIRLSMPGEGEVGEPLGVPGFGTQLQTAAVAGTVPEGNFFISWEFFPVTFPDGHQVILRQPYYTFYNTYVELPESVLRSGRNAPALIGLGLLAAIPEADLISREDPADADGDYISGIANRVWDYRLGHYRVGRFGWKGGSPDVVQQTADAFLQDMGITSAGIFPVEACLGQSNCLSPGALPDVSLEQVKRTAFYLQSTGVPARRNIQHPDVVRGKLVFHELGCAGCHIPEWRTGSSPHAFLSNQLIYPYTDLLLHDMGEGLGDGRPEYLASANDWRTPPLWGIGLAKVVNPEGTFLHDGRAETVEEAILWHGGEAIHTRNAYIDLPAADRHALMRFLESL